MGDTALVGNGGVLEIVDFSDPAFPEKIGEVVTPGMIRDIAVAESWVYIADGVAGLLVVDIHDPTSPQIVWSWDFPGYYCNDEVLSVKIDTDGFLYFLSRLGVSRVDISNPASPSIVHVYGGGGIDIGFAVGNGYVYISGYDDMGPPQFTILDISSGAALLQTNGPRASDMEYYSGHVYANNGYASNCAILDVSDPANFSGACRNFEAFAFANALEISSGIVFLATSTGLSIYEITDPLVPTFESSLAFSPVYDMSIADERLYAACGEKGVVAVSIDDLNSPFVLGRYEVPGILRDAYADSAHVLIAAGRTLRVLDRDEEGELREVGRLDLGRTVQCVYEVGSVAYAGTQDGVFLVDIATPGAPTTIDSLAMGDVAAIDGNGENLFALGDVLSVLDASNPIYPIVLNTLPGGIYLDVQGSLVAVGDYSSLKVYDLADASSPAELYSTSLFGGHGFALSDEFFIYGDAYGVYSRNLFTGEEFCIACGWGGPWRFGSIAAGMRRVYFEYFSSAIGGLYKTPEIGVSDPSKDSYPDGCLGAIQRVPTYSSKLHVFDDLLYDADDEAGLLVYGAPGGFFALASSPDRYIDAFSQIPYDTLGGFKILCASSQPTGYVVELKSPDLSIQVGGGAFSHSVIETTVMAPGDSFSMSPVVVSIPEISARLETDISCIVHPVEYPGLSDTAAIHMAIDPPVATAFVAAEAAASEGGCLIRWRVSDPSQVATFDILRSIDRTEPARWELIADNLEPATVSYLDAGYPRGEDLLYRIAANMEDGDRILSRPIGLHLAKGKLALYANQPNPFNPSTKIAFRVPRAGHVELKIYSAEGKLVATLIDGDMTEGYHSIEWNGSNDLGQPVGSGIYFCRLRTLKQERVRKMALVK
jgi:hypothetical protein